MPRGTELELDVELGERGVYIIAGGVTIAGAPFAAERLVVVDAGRRAVLCATLDSTLMLLGGAPFAEERAIWWNFVASSGALIESAKHRWAAGEFPGVPGDEGSMPLPR